MKIKLKKEFAEILEKEGLLQEFLQNVKVEAINTHQTIQLKTDSLNRISEFYQVIIRAFEWEKTPQGHDFWSNLYDKYYDISTTPA